MAIFTRQLGSPSSVPLASIYDAANPRRLAEFVTAIQARVGALEGAPKTAAAAAAAESLDSASPGLLTPLRGLTIADGPPSSAARSRSSRR